MSAVAIRTDRLTRRFGASLALDELSIDVAEGEVLALLGPNGAGKTTTVRLLDGVLAPDGGSSTVLGFDPAVEPDEVRRRTGVLTEHAGLDDRLTATENLMTTARIRGMDDDLARRRVGELLERFGMSARADQLVVGASTGQRKRIALARSLLHDPEVLFLDEPTSGLDPAAIRDVVALIDSLAAEQGRTVVLCTHFLGEADELADRMAMLHHGRLEAFGRPADLAADLWSGVPTTIELGGPASAETAARVRAVRGVQTAEPNDVGLALTVDAYDVVPQVVAELVHEGASVFAARPATRTVSDIYFEIERRREATP
jgi:ABC-2 type transport system ATP-binding protein